MKKTIDSFAVHETLAGHSTYEIGGTARFFANPATAESLVELLQLANSSGLKPIFFGMGSNLLFSDHPDPEAVFISLSEMAGMEIRRGKLFVSAGTPMSALAIVGHLGHFPDFDFTFLLPGTLGGGIYMNAKYFGSQMCDILETVYYIDLAAVPQGVKSIGSEACGFAYKDSIFQHHPWLIVGADLKAELSPRLEETLVILGRSGKVTRLHASALSGFASLYVDTIQNAAYGEHPVSPAFADTIRDRMGKKHFDYPSCGSVFKNNYSYGVPIGKLVEELNLKGTAYGNAMISPFHGNMILNKGGAKASEVVHLIKTVQEAVDTRFGFIPEPELVIL